MPLNLKLNECIVNMNEFSIKSFHESVSKEFVKISDFDILF